MRNNRELLYWFKDLSKDDIKIVCSLKVFLIENDIKRKVLICRKNLLRVQKLTTDLVISMKSEGLKSCKKQNRVIDMKKFYSQKKYNARNKFLLEGNN